MKMIKKQNLKEDKLRSMFLLPFFLVCLGLVASFISFSKQNYYILGGDLYYPLVSKIDLLRTPFAWDVRYATGGTSEARHIPSLIYFLYFFLLDKLSIPLIVAQKIAVFSIFTLTAPAMYYLVLVIIQDQKKEIESRDHLIAFIAALFYNYNLWNLFNWAAPSVHLQLSYFAAPLVLAFFIKGIKEFNFLYVVYLAILYVLIAPAASNPIYILNTIWPVVFFITFILIKQAVMHDWKGLTQSMLFSLSVLAIFILINFWWILLMLDALKDSVKIIENSGNIWGWLDWKSTRSSFLNIFRLTNHEAWVHTTPGSLIIASAQGYVKNFFLIFTSFVFPILAFSSLLKKKKNFYVLYFSILAVTMIFLSKGAHAPLGSINGFLHQKFLILTLYRSVEWYTPMIVLSYSFLLGEGTLLAYDFLKQRGKTQAKYILVLSIIVIIFVFNYPFWTGKVVHQGKWTGEIANPYFVKIPNWYFEASRWINNQQDDFRILSAPSDDPYYHTDWGFSGGELGIFLFNKPIINNIFGWAGTKKLSTIILDYLNDGTGNKKIVIARLLGLMNIKYVTLRHDGAYWNGDRMIKIKKNTRQVYEKLEYQNDISLENTIGKIDFFKNNNFLPHIYPASGNATIVTGNINSLIPLTYTPYLDDYPALAFTEQQNYESMRSLISSQQSAVNNQMLFANSNFNDMIVDLARAEVEAKGDRREIRDVKQKPILVKLNKRGKGKFKVGGGGVYEVWIKNGQGFEAGGRRLEVEGQGLEVSIDGEELEGWKGREGDKWIKVGEKELDSWLYWFDWLKGKHRIKVESTWLEVRGNKYMAEEFQKMIRDLEVVIVSKDKMKEYENLLKSKDIGYLFHVDKEKIENMLKDEEKLKEIKLKKENPFKIGEQEFYIPNDGVYSVKALVKPKGDFLEEGFVSSSSSSSSSSSRASSDAISGWHIKALNTAFKKDILEDGMHIDAYFQNKGDVKEGVVLTKKFPDISIREMPYLALSIEMEELGVQEIEIDVKLTDTSKRFFLFRTKKIRLKADNKQYVINLYEKAKDERLKADGKNLLVEEVTLKFKKKDGVDVSDEKKRQTYSFVFKNIAFLKHQPILAKFEDKLSAYLPDKFYYFDENGDLKGVDFPEQIPSWNVKDVYRLHLNRFIDLKETPVLSLNFPKPSMEDWKEDWRFGDGERRTEFPQEWKVLLSLDFDGDEKENDRIEIFVPAAGLSDGKLLLSIKAYEEVKKQFPDKKNYNLLSVGISHPDDKVVLYQAVMNKKLIRYREHVYKPLEVRGGRLEAKGERIEAKGKRQEAKGAGVLEVDGKIYKLPLEAKGEGQKAKGKDNNWIEFNGIYLKEGEHSLNVFENDKFKVEMVEIGPEVGGKRLEAKGERQETENKRPEITFKKINPTRYVVDVKGAKGPFTLVFSESFHEGWKGYVRKRPEVRGQRLEAEDKEKIEAQALSLRPQTSNNEHFASNLQPPASNSNEPWSALWSAWGDRGERIEIKEHFVVNGYANGWIVQAGLKANGERQRAKSEGREVIGEDFEIVLEYKPQRLFEVGLIVSATTLIGCIGYLGYNIVRLKVRGRRMREAE